MGGVDMLLKCLNQSTTCNLQIVVFKASSCAMQNFRPNWNNVVMRSLLKIAVTPLFENIPLFDYMSYLCVFMYVSKLYTLVHNLFSVY